MLRMKPTILAATFLAAAALSAPAAADKVDDAIGKAAEAYKKGSLATAMQELQYAVTKIGERLSKAYSKTFPDAPEGWTARKVSISSGNALVRMSGQIMNRRYRQKDGKGSIEAQMIVDNPAMQGYVTLFSNPAYARQAGYDRVKIDGVPEPAMVKFNEDRGRGDVVLLTGSRILIRVSGRGIKNADVLVAFVKAWKVAEARKIAGIQ